MLTAASQAYSSFDIPYPYRPNTDFLYLTGFCQPNAVLVIDNLSMNKEARLTMFVERRDALKETWEGARAGPSVAERVWLAILCPLCPFNLRPLPRALCATSSRNFVEQVFGADVAYETEILEHKLEETLRAAEHVMCAVDGCRRVDRHCLRGTGRFSISRTQMLRSIRRSSASFAR